MQFKRYFKEIIGPIITGFLFYFFVILGANVRLISNNVILLTGIIGGIILLYSIIHGIIRAPYRNLILGVFGSGVAEATMWLGLFPTALFFDNTNFSSLKKIETNPIEFQENSSLCHKVKYGTFSNGMDTIIRYSENGQDFELTKSSNQEKQCKIEWLDSCTYVRINKSNNALTRYVKIGVFMDNSHQLYSKPAGSDNFEGEKIETFFELQ